MKRKSKSKVLSRSEQMSRIKGDNTTIEIMLRKELWSRGIRYRKNYKKLIGKPDIAITSKKVAIFCDSEFWHGKEYLEGRTPKTNSDYWEKKFKRNIARDIKVNQELKKEGWIVLRFWEKDIKNNLNQCADKIENTLKDIE